MVDVFFLGPGKDEDGVQVEKHIAVQHVPDHIVHQGLEHSRTLVRPKSITMA